MKRKALTVWEALVIVATVAIGAAILTPTHHNREGARRSSCQSNLKQIGLAVAQYSLDYNNTFPPHLNAQTLGTARGMPYASQDQRRGVFQCPSTRAHARDTSDYFINARSARARARQLTDSKGGASFTILGGEGQDDQISSRLSQLPAAWRTDQSSPAWRHLGGANYLFADGHVKWYRAEKITLDTPAAERPTF